ncbi:MAG: diadenylate cyclase CdaA [Anaerolineales bacterium]|nr:diadenylate cyclase CdaA [Anaerolineales bacterium]
MTNLVQNVLFLFQRLHWYDVLDIGLVALLFFILLTQFRGTQAGTVLRGIAMMIVGVALLTSVAQLPAVSWILETILPALLIVIPVVFAPEIRRTLERVGRADFLRRASPMTEVPPYIQAVVAAAKRLSERRHGALIVIERDVGLDDFSCTGLRLDADVSAELMMQIFYPNTPLHDGAVILRRERILAAGCVVPLSSGNVLASSDRRMGLRHRAALGISEVSDAVAVVVSEETGILSVAHNGRMIRRLDPQRLQNILLAFTRNAAGSTIFPWTLFRRKSASPAVRPTEPEGAESEERHPE